MPRRRPYNDLVQHVPAIAAYPAATPRLFACQLTAMRHQSYVLSQMLEIEIDDRPWTLLSAYHTPDVPTLRSWLTPNQVPGTRTGAHSKPSPTRQTGTPRCTQTPGWTSHPSKSDGTICCTQSIGAGDGHPHQGHHPSAVQQEEPNAVREMVDRLLALLCWVLYARGRGAARHTVACLDQVNRGEPLANVLVWVSTTAPCTTNNGSASIASYSLEISRAARVLEESQIGTVTDKVLKVLNALHPHKDAPQPPEAEDCPAQITSRILAKVLDMDQCRSTVGPSG